MVAVVAVAVEAVVVEKKQNPLKPHTSSISTTSLVKQLINLDKTPGLQITVHATHQS